MGVLVSLPRNVYGSGATPQAPVVVSVPAKPVPSNLDIVRIRLARNSWPNIGQDVMRTLLEISYDGGVTWGGWFFTMTGGNVNDIHGQPATESSLEFDLQPEGAVQRQYRGTVTLFSPLDTAVTVEAV